MNETTERTDQEVAHDITSSHAAADRGIRRILAGLFLLLASLGVMVSTVTSWAHQSVLTTEGWTDVVGEIVTDPEVIDAAGGSPRARSGSGAPSPPGPASERIEEPRRRPFRHRGPDSAATGRSRLAQS